MAVARVVARFNRRVWNPIVRGAAGRLPPFAVLIHQGRISGRTYRTPVAAFPNVLAQGAPSWSNAGGRSHSRIPSCGRPNRHRPGCRP